MLNKILIIAFFLFLSATAFGQRCGAGYRTVKIYALNGLEAKNLKYEYFSLTPKGLNFKDKKSIKFIEDTLFPDRENKIYANFYGPEIIENEVAEKFLKDYKKENFYSIQRDSDIYYQNIKDIKLKGMIENGVIKNFVGETYLYNFLMKISSDNYPSVYVAGTHFGLCSRTENILLKKDGAELKLNK